MAASLFALSANAEGGKEQGTTPDSVLGALSFTSGHEPISVTADTLEFDYKRRVITYKGHVIATQADMKLESDTLIIRLADGAAQQLKEVLARGNVRLSKGENWATAGEAVFDQVQRRAVLSKDAVLHNGPTNEVAGERVVVYLDEERTVVEGGSGQRVRARLEPPQKGSPAAEAANTP